MKRFAFFILTQLVSIAFIVSAGASQFKVHVAEFTVTGAANKDEMRSALQTLLQSRLSSGAVKAVESRGAADIVVNGSYIVFGKIFSLDAVAKNSDGKIVGRSFVQGDGQEELIPAVGKLATSLLAEIEKSYSVTDSPIAQPSPPAVREAAKPAQSDIIRPPQGASAGGWMSQRLTGAFSAIALGRTLSGGEQEIFLGGNQTLRYYRKGKDLQLVSEVKMPTGSKILGIDTGDCDADGTPEIYVTIRSGGQLTSEVYLPAEGALTKTGANLPYFFRSIAVGAEKKVYAQQVDMDDNFFGDVYEVVKKGEAFTIANPLKLPKGGNLYNFNRITGSDGKPLFILLNNDGYLVVYSAQRDEIWRSSDKYGGSELYYEKAVPSSAFSNNVFIDQRIVVSAKGEIIVPQNAGFWVVGNNRSYSKYSVFGFSWNGVSLEEKWRTKQSQNYLADFAYDYAANQLLLLEVVQKESAFSKGASAVAVKKLD